MKPGSFIQKQLCTLLLMVMVGVPLLEIQHWVQFHPLIHDIQSSAHDPEIRSESGINQYLESLCIGCHGVADSGAVGVTSTIDHDFIYPLLSFVLNAFEHVNPPFLLPILRAPPIF